jgi:hypothetical protein
MILYNACSGRPNHYADPDDTSRTLCGCTITNAWWPSGMAREVCKRCFRAWKKRVKK